MPKAFQRELRETVVAAALVSEEPHSKLAAEFGISESCLHRWLQLHKAQNPAGNTTTRSDTDELRDLRRHVRILEEEKLILRRAAASFAREITPR